MRIAQGIWPPRRSEASPRHDIGAGGGNRCVPAALTLQTSEETEMRVPHNSFILVADGKKSLFFRNEGDGDFPNLIVERKDGHADLEDREQKSDAPGRTFSGQGTGARSAYQETDYHQLEEEKFAAETAELLKERALRNDFESLIVVAPPRTLGALRKHYHKEVEKRLAGEIAKDLTGHPVTEIEKILSAQ
jgi:protein required for attachment to host cells